MQKRLLEKLFEWLDQALEPSVLEMTWSEILAVMKMLGEVSGCFQERTPTSASPEHGLYIKLNSAHEAASAVRAATSCAHAACKSSYTSPFGP